MNSLFGDASTAAPTPQTLAEAESLFSGNRSPIGSFRLGEQGEPVPDMDPLQPPDVNVEGGKPMLSKDNESQKEGVGGWISNLVKRNKDGEANGSGKYKRLGDDEEDEGQR